MSPRYIAIYCAFAALTGLCLAGASGCAMFRKDSLAKQSSKAANESGVSQASYESTEDEGLSLKDFSPDNISKTTKKLTGNGPNKEIAQKSFDEADALYKQAAAAEGAKRAELFSAAGEKFTAAAERYPSSALEQNALFYAAESYFFADMYLDANKNYEKVIKAYPNNRFLDTIDQRRFVIAKYWLDLNRQEPESAYYFNWTDNTRPWRDARGNALRLYDKIRIDDPTGKLADDATLAAGNENLLAGKFIRPTSITRTCAKRTPRVSISFLPIFWVSRRSSIAISGRTIPVPRSMKRRSSSNRCAGSSRSNRRKNATLSIAPQPRCVIRKPKKSGAMPNTIIIAPNTAQRKHTIKSC